MADLRCVIDTNVLISAALNPAGLPNRLVAHVFEHGAVLVSEALLDELRSRVMRPQVRVHPAPGGCGSALPGTATEQPDLA